MEPGEPNWRVNSSFSPPLPRGWDCRFQSDGNSNATHGARTYGSSVSSHSKGSRSGVSSDQYPNHHHSVSDGALSYLESPGDNLQAPRWTPPLQQYDLGEFSTPAGGARPETAIFSECNERRFTAGVPSISSSLGSPSPLSESSRWASTSKHPILFPPRNLSGRRSFMSKPVYPLVFRDPASDGEAVGMAGSSIVGRTGGDNSSTSPLWPGSTFSPDLKFHKTLTELQKMEASPDPNMSSGREGFRWSNASSYDFGFDGDAIDMSEHMSLENLRSPNTNSARYQRCGFCERPLWQKSPWSSHRIVRSSDMPIAGVLPCRHVFHADCLEETTPKGQIHEPPCPVCLKVVGAEGSISFSEPLQVALRSGRRSQRAGIAGDGVGSSSSPNLAPSEGDLRRNQSLPMTRRGSSLIKSHFRKRFSFKGKMGKNIFGAKIFGRSRSSSSSSFLCENQSQAGRLRFHEAPRQA